MEKRMEAQIQEALEAATPVPQSFEQAVTWACSASIAAAEAGVMRQTMYFDAAGGDTEVSGELGSVLAFAESVSKTLVEAEALEGGSVTVLFTDMGASAMSTSRWEPLPEKLKVTYFPQVLRGSDTIGQQERKKFMEILESEVVVIVAPTQNELPALLQLLMVMEETGKDVPIILMNAKLVQNTYIAAGNLLRSARELEKTLVPTFHLEQYDPSDEEEFVNSAVITRTWPRPFSLWEDNPEDPEAVDGFFLLDLNDKRAQEGELIRQFMKDSMMLAKKLAEKSLKR